MRSSAERSVTIDSNLRLADINIVDIQIQIQIHLQIQIQKLIQIQICIQIQIEIQVQIEMHTQINRDKTCAWMYEEEWRVISNN